MKIRTDFVTNSSSSSFVAMLDAVLDNGERLTASVQTSHGGEGDGWIKPPHADFEWDSYKIESMERLAGKCVEIDGRKSKIQSGSVHLMCHTYGEYGYEADPKELISKYLGDKWKAAFALINPDEDEDVLVGELKEVPALENYTEVSLRTLIRLVCEEDEYGPDTEIIHTLNPDGTYDLEVETGDDLFDMDDYDDFIGDEEDEDQEDDEDTEEADIPDHRKGKLVLFSDQASTEPVISKKFGDKFYSGTEKELQMIETAFYKEYQEKYCKKMLEESEISIDEHLNGPWLRRIEEYARANMDLEEEVIIPGKRFEISTKTTAGRTYKEAVEKEISKRGGIPQMETYGYVKKDTDYFVISPAHSDFIAAKDMKYAIKKKNSGQALKIVTEWQLWKAIANTEEQAPVSADDNKDEGKYDENLTGKITDVSYEFCLQFQLFEEMKASVIDWIKTEGYNLSVDQKDDAETFFKALGFEGVFPDDNLWMIYMQGQISDCSSLGYPFLKLLKRLSPYYMGMISSTEIDLCTFKCDGHNLQAAIHKANFSVMEP